MKKKTKRKPVPNEIRSEYEFSKGVRGKYAHRFAEGTNIVKLEPDVARVFRTSASVNRALRSLASGRLPSKRAV
jgi:hypothetical protein